MAQKQLVQITDDLDGTVLDPDDVAEVRFALDGSSYVIDLSKANAFLLRSTIQRYSDAARRDTTTASSRAGGGPKSAGKRDDLEQVRQWAASHGHTVAPRGRIAKTVLDAYDAR